MFDYINREKAIKLKFRLIPVIHIGSEKYYQEIFDFLNECDEVIFEGIQVKAGRGFTGQYKAIAKKLGLVTQRESLPLKKLTSKLIHADFTTASGRKNWWKLKFTEKIELEIIKPIRLFIQTRGLTRQKLAKQYMHSARESFLAYGPLPDVEGTAENFIMDTREQIVIEILKKKINLEGGKDKLVGILYGAGHMKTFSRYLIDQQNYVAQNGQFLKVFNIV